MCCDELLQFNRPYCDVQILQGALRHRGLVHFRRVQPHPSGGTVCDRNANQWNHGCSQNQEDILRLLRLPGHQNHHHLFHCHHHEPRLSWACGTAWQPEGFVQTSSNDGAWLSTHQWNQTLLLRLRCIPKTGSQTGQVPVTVFRATVPTVPLWLRHAHRDLHPACSP